MNIDISKEKADEIRKAVKSQIESIDPLNCSVCVASNGRVGELLEGTT